MQSEDCILIFFLREGGQIGTGGRKTLKKYHKKQLEIFSLNCYKSARYKTACGFKKKIGANRFRGCGGDPKSCHLRQLEFRD